MNSLENLLPKQNKSHNKSQAITMYYLQEKAEELLQFVKQFDPFIAGIFLLDYKCVGTGTVIYDVYHRRIKCFDTFNILEFRSFMDIFSFILFMYSVFFDILYNPRMNIGESQIKETFKTLFFVKYIEYVILAKISNSQHKKINCIVCLKKPKQQLLNPNQSMIKYCICVCRKCERLSDDCDACKFTILTHFR